MSNQIVYTSSQKEILQYLYKYPGPKKSDDIMRHCHNFNHNDLLALCSDEYENVITLTPSWSGKWFKITPAGRAVVETMQKQAEDEAYQRDYDAKALETAKESNDIAKAAKKQSTIANWLSGIAIVVSILSAIIAFWELRS